MFSKELPLAINDTSGVRIVCAAPRAAARTLGNARALFWVFALVAGLGTALLLARYLDKRGGGQAVAISGVVVAAPICRSRQAEARRLKVIEWPADHLPPGASAIRRSWSGRVLISRVLAQQPLLPGMLAAKNAGSGLAALIPSNMRAIAVRVDDVVGVAGFIHADDRVDVMVTMRPIAGASRPPRSSCRTSRCSRSVRRSTTATRAGSTRRPPPWRRLLVSPQDAERLVLAQTEGRIMLTLRSWTDSQPVDTDGASPSGWSAAARRVSASRRRRRAAPAHQAGRRGKGGKAPPPPPTLAAEAPPRRTPSRFCAVTGSSSATSTAERSDSDDPSAAWSRHSRW
jgi:pilus assembly protein CpaB